MFLLDNKASIEATTTGRGPALLAATCSGQFDVARTLVDRGADVNARTPSQTALGCAALRRNVGFIQFLLDKGADINLRASLNGYSPLHHALSGISTTDIDRATASGLLLISLGANVNVTHPDVGTPLDLAVQYRLLEVVRALLDKGANPNTAGARYALPLTMALTGRSPNADIAMLLIDRGADVNAIGTAVSDMTPLMLAIQARQVGVVRALLAKGANPNLPNKNGVTPLLVASESPEIVQLLINAGAKQ